MYTYSYIVHVRTHLISDGFKVVFIYSIITIDNTSEATSSDNTSTHSYKIHQWILVRIIYTVELPIQAPGFPCIEDA